MKKIFAMILTIAMFTMTSFSVFAGQGSLTTSDGSQEITVTAKFVPGIVKSPVYKVDIEWGSMEFTYSERSDGVWNPETHVYDGKRSNNTWSCEENANRIKITNHSNVAIRANLSQKMVSGVYGGFYNDNNEEIKYVDIGTGDIYHVENAPTAEIFFKITSGWIKSDTDSLCKLTISLGSVTE